jgi:hypothetical protein
MPPKQDESAAFAVDESGCRDDNPKSLQQQHSYGASCTSFYTNEEKRDSYESLYDVLQSKCFNEKLRICIQDLMETCANITEALRSTLVHVEGSTNDFGDTQLSVDVSFLCLLIVVVLRIFILLILTELSISLFPVMTRIGACRQAHLGGCQTVQGDPRRKLGRRSRRA